MPETITHKKANARRSDIDKQWQDTTAKLAEARTHLAHCEIACGQKIADGEDATAESAALQSAESAVKQFESAVAILWQRKEDADAASRDAARQAAVEAAVQAVAEVKSACEEMDQLILSIGKVAVDKIAPRLNTAREVLSRSGVNDGELYFLNEVPGVVKQSVQLVLYPLIGSGFVPVNMRKYARCSDCIPDEAYIRSRPRVAPSPPKAIPNWQQSEN